MNGESVSNTDANREDAVVDQVRIAEEMRRYRERAGISRAELATRVGYSRTYISTCEKPGASLVSKAVVTRIDEELGAEGALIALHALADAERRSRRTSRQTAAGAVTHVDLSGAPTAFGDVWGTEWADLAAAMQPGGVTASMVEHADQVVCQIHSQFAKVAPTEMLPVVNEHLRATTKLLTLGQPTVFRRRLCSIAGHLAGQRAWLLFDLRRADHAESWFGLALDPAQEAGDDALVAWLLGGHSVVAFDRGDTRKSLQLLDRARLHASRVAGAPVAGWVDALEARALATVGEAGLARRSISRARRGTWRVADDTHRHGMDVQNGELNVDYYEGGSLLASGDSVPAREVLEKAIAAQGQEHLKGRAVVTLQVAMTHAMEHDIEQAVNLAVAAWGVPDAQRIGPISERVHQLRRMVSSAADGSYVERLDQLLAAPSGSDRV